MTAAPAVRTVVAMTTAAAEATVDEQAAEAFAGRLLDIVAGSTLTYMIDIGHRTGLFATAAGMGPATSVELAERTGLQERYVREWLGAMATGGIFEYDAEGERYWLPTEHAVSLVGHTVENLAPLAYLATVLGKHVEGVAAAFRDGGGVPYEAYVPELHDVMEQLWGPIYDGFLVEAIVPLVPGLLERLEAGVRVADVACGTGRALVNLASAYPASTFVGYDLDPLGVERCRRTAEERGIANLSFEVADAAALVADEPFDAVFVFNALHDQASPEGMLARIHEALAPGGLLILNEPRLSSRLEENIGNPMAPFIYGVSTLHCLTVSLAQGGAGLGTAFGEDTALRLLAETGFGPVAVHDAPGDPANAVFVTTRA